METCRDKSTWGNKSYRSSRGTFSNKSDQMRGKAWRQESVNYLNCKKHSFILWGFIVGSLSSDVFERRRSVHTSANLIFHFPNKNGKRKNYLSLSYLHILKYRKNRKKKMVRKIGHCFIFLILKLNSKIQKIL